MGSIKIRATYVDRSQQDNAQVDFLEDFSARQSRKNLITIDVKKVLLQAIKATEHNTMLRYFRLG